MTLMTYVYLIAGLVLLVAGAEVLVRGAAKLAAQFGIPPLVIGLTVVAFGTSAPETAVSVQSALNGITKYGTRRTVTLIPGDGTGPELAKSVRSVFRLEVSLA